MNGKTTQFCALLERGKLPLTKIRLLAHANALCLYYGGAQLDLILSHDCIAQFVRDAQSRLVPFRLDLLGARLRRSGFSRISFDRIVYSPRCIYPLSTAAIRLLLRRFLLLLPRLRFWC